MNLQSQFPLKWEKHRFSSEQMELLDKVVKTINQNLNRRFHIIRQPFGKMLACVADELIIFHIGDGGRPPVILTVAATVQAQTKVFFPAASNEDFEACCEILSLKDANVRQQFKCLLNPQPRTRKHP